MELYWILGSQNNDAKRQFLLERLLDAVKQVRNANNNGKSAWILKAFFFFSINAELATPAKFIIVFSSLQQM